MNMHQSAQQHPACSQSSGTLPPACRRAPSSRRASRSPRAPLSPLSSEASVQGPGCISSYHAGRPRRQQSLCAALSLPYVTAPISQQVCNSRKHRAGASQALVCASSSREAAATVEAQQGEQAAPTRALVSEPEVHGALPSDLPGNPYWWTEVEGAGGYEDDDGEDVTVLTPEEVTERVDEAAALISLIDDLRPIQQNGYNPFAAIWLRLRRVPPSARVRVLEELDPGAVRCLWRASLGRYVLPDVLAQHLLRDFSVLEDFPTQPGEVYEYVGWIETLNYQSAESPFSVDSGMQSMYPRSSPWLRPNTGQVSTRRRRLRAYFFIHPRSGLLHARIVPQLLGPFDNIWAPLYATAHPGLVLTPLESDAGADMTLQYGPREGVREAMRAAEAKAGADMAGAEGPPPARPSGPSPYSRTRQKYLESQGLITPGTDTQGSASAAGNTQGPSQDDSTASVIGAIEAGDLAGTEFDTWQELLPTDLPVQGWPKPLPDEEAPLSPFSGTEQ